MLPVEVGDLLFFAVLEDFEIGLVEIRNEAVLVVGHRDRHDDFIDLYLNGRLVRRLGRLRKVLRGLRCLLLRGRLHWLRRLLRQSGGSPQPQDRKITATKHRSTHYLTTANGLTLYPAGTAAFKERLHLVGAEAVEITWDRVLQARGRNREF